jgi:hypothetical protein
MAVVRHDFKAIAGRLRAKQGGSTPKEEVLPPPRRRGAFATEAVQIWESIASMRTFMREQAAPGRTRLMSPAERDEVDNVGSEFLAVCSKRLDALKAVLEHPQPLPAEAAPRSAQHRAHMKGTLNHLYEQLSALAAQLDGFRAAFAEEARRLRERELVPITRTAAADRHAHAVEPEWEQVAGCVLDDDELLASLSADERQQLEQENAEYEAELHSKVDEVRVAESKMMEISALSSTFAAKLAEQSKSIEHIQEDSIAASEYVRTGNKSLESAERHAKGFRLWWMLFFLLAGVTLLLADWWYS